ncbi:SET and MYND domain-containing protein 5 [Chytridiales sp. JEL 0842]|nr:SET and MYND domain-containing protein 5 [Chytridiales sp. JEL 0842]
MSTLMTTFIGPIAVARLPGKGNSVFNILKYCIPAGTILLIEKPFHAWPTGTYNVEQLTAQLLVRCRRDPQASKALARLCPVELRHIPPARLEQIPNATVDRIIELAENMDWSFSEPSTTPKQKERYTRSEVLRLYYVLECNSFPSGLNLAISNVNHSCEPNSCVTEEYYTDATKVLTESTKPMPNGTAANRVNPEKELHYHLTALREIEPGEEITISYLNSSISLDLAEDRQRHLEEHYLFHCSCPLCEGGPPDPSDPEQRGTPRREDFKCGFWETLSSSPPVDLKGCGKGQLSKVLGVCCDCGLTLPLKVLRKGLEKADKLIVKLRTVFERVNNVLEKLGVGREDEVDSSAVRKKLESLGCDGKVLELEGMGTIDVRGLWKMLKDFEKQVSKLFHESHVIVVPLTICVGKLETVMNVLAALAKANLRQNVAKAVGPIE